MLCFLELSLVCCLPWVRLCQEATALQGLGWGWVRHSVRSMGGSQTQREVSYASSPTALPLADLHLFASLSWTSWLTAGESVPVAVDGGCVVLPGGPLACTYATLADPRIARRCGPPGAQPLGCPPVGPCAIIYIPLHPAFSPASRGPSRMPSRWLHGPGKPTWGPWGWAGCSLGESPDHQLHLD